MRKFLKGSKKGSNLHELNENNYDNIVIKKDKKKFWIKSTIKILSFIVLGFIISFIAFNIAFEYYKKDIKIGEQKSSLLQKAKDGRYDITNLVNTSAGYIVTVGEDKKALDLGKNTDKNVTGIVIRSDGYILTSYSAIKGFSKFYVKLSSNEGSSFKANLIGDDVETDIAILKIESSGLQSLPVSELDVFEVGERVATLGNITAEKPLGFVANGIVTSPMKKIIIGEERHSDSKVFNLVETNSIINSENNSGVLCNYSGEVIGINSIYFTNKFKKEGVYYALEINDALRVADSIIRYGNVSNSVTLGITGATVADENHNILGIYVENVDKGSNAFNAGIRPTDIIIELEGHKVENIEDLAEILKKHSVGDIIKVKVKRGESIKDISITLA